MSETLNYIQTKLKATKDKHNSFGNYNYRSCESILEAVKPLLQETKATLVISDEIVLIGDRFYIKSTATLTDKDGNQTSATGFAREELEKKGMDASQLTGSTSSYARKYALNGLLAIDDNKDADTDEYQKETLERAKKLEIDIGKVEAYLGHKPSNEELESAIKTKEQRLSMTKKSEVKSNG